MIACAFPYVIAFTSDTMEIRLIINGNLVHTIAMPNLNLITSKRDIFFATTAPEFLPGKCERIRLDSKPFEKEEMPCSPPPQSSSSSRSSIQSTWSLIPLSSLRPETFIDSKPSTRSLSLNVWQTHWGQPSPNLGESSFRRQSRRLEADKDLSDTTADAVEKHGVQLQSEEVSESRRAGNRLCAADLWQDLSERRTSTCAEQVLQQQSYTHTDHEFTIAM